MTQTETRTLPEQTAGGEARPASGRSWAGLLAAAGVAEAVTLLAVAAWLGDLEAALVGVGVGVAVALRRVRRGRLGAALLGLLSANVLAWMALGTVSGLANRDGVGTLVIPATLTALAAVVLVASVAVLVGRGQPRRSAAPGIVAGMVAAVLGAVLLVGALTAGARVTAQPDDLVLASERLRFSETRLEVDAGEIGVALENGDLFWHTFTIDELGVDLAVPVGATRRIAFSAEPGTYTFYCRVPGHETVMRGTLTVR